MLQFAGILLGMFGISVMQLILATAMPFIVTDIGGGELYSWVFSAYLLASLFTIPIFSKLADLYGKKTFYLAGMSLFALGTLYGGLAPSMEHLVFARVIQGLGAGMIIPISMALISDLFSEEKRGNMIGVFGVVQLLANLLSPTLGSFFTKQLGWHWIFYITLGVVIAALVLVGHAQHSSTPARLVRWQEVDAAGGLLFGIVCILLVFFSRVAGGGFGWQSGLLCVGIGLAALSLYWLETHHPNPVIKVTFFRTSILRRSIISSLIAGGIMYGLVTILPLCGVILNQNGQNIDESQILFLFMLGITLGLLAGSRLLKSLNAAFPKIMWGISLAGAGLLYFSINTNNYWLFYITLCGVGLCLGGIMATMLINSQNAVSSEDRTVLSGLVQLGRYLGASIGVTLLTGMLPEVSQIASIAQFLGAFGLLAVMYMAGLVNEAI